MDISRLSWCVPGGSLCKPCQENAGQASRSYSKQKPKGKQSINRGRGGEGRDGLGRGRSTRKPYGWRDPVLPSPSGPGGGGPLPACCEPPCLSGRQAAGRVLWAGPWASLYHSLADNGAHSTSLCLKEGSRLDDF